MGRRLLIAFGLVLVLVAMLVWMTIPERVSPSEPADIATIRDGILKVQAGDAAKQNRRSLAGLTRRASARAEFEVLDVMSTVADRTLAARLARGLYATPGRYPATLRFANADSNINNDSKPDVRALSFAVEAPGKPRQDFSTNDRTTFPINDAHAFATTIKVVTAPTMAAGVWSLPFKDKLSFARTAVLGQLQEHQSMIPYQRRRYWSTVPFRHGPSDVIKHSATPCVGNPAGDLARYDPNTLQDELGTSKLTAR